MTQHPKPCVTCRFHLSDWGSNCINPAMDTPCPVRGATHNHPNELRQPQGACGPEGKGWTRRLSFLEHIFGERP